VPPKGYVNNYMVATLQDWIKAETDKKHSMAVKYIEENVDLIDNDLQKFMDSCPASCQLEVYEMLLKAGIDMKDYAIRSSLKQWEKYVHDANPQFHQYYTIDYKQELDEYITQEITSKLDKVWKISSLVEEA
jgi:hypothetical protein